MMKFIFILIVILFILGLLRRKSSKVFWARVSYVYDGDTIKIKTSSGREDKVRLAEIDAPESNGQPWGKESKLVLRRLLTGKNIKLKIVNRDKYDRLIAHVFYKGGSVNHWMVKEGHAMTYRGFARSHKIKRLESLAKRKRKGLWSLSRKYWIEPRIWRANN